MPSLIDMRRRIRAVKSTQQITKAMKMVAASKLRRAQERVIATRPFAKEARRVLASIASRVDQTKHPLLVRRAGRRTRRDAASRDHVRPRVCAAASTPTSSRPSARSCARTRGRPISFGLVGRKGRDMLGRRGLPVRFEYVNLPKIIAFAEAEAIAAPAIQDFIEGRVDSVLLIYNEFKSVMQQKVVVEQLLPLAPITEGEMVAATTETEYLYEPSAQAIFDAMLQRPINSWPSVVNQSSVRVAPFVSIHRRTIVLPLGCWRRCGRRAFIASAYHSFEKGNAHGITIQDPKTTGLWWGIAQSAHQTKAQDHQRPTAGDEGTAGVIADRSAFLKGEVLDSSNSLFHRRSSSGVAMRSPG